MNSEGRIGVFEGTCLTTLAMINKIFFTSVGNIVYQTGTAAWYTTLISCLCTLLFFLFYYLLLKRFPGRDLPSILEIVLGKVIGKVILLVLVAYGLFNAGSTLREFVEMIKVYNLPTTPTSLIMITFLAVSIIVCYSGLPSLARICALCLIPCLICLGLILLMALPSYNPNLLKPFGGHGVRTTLKLGFLRSSAYFEFVLLAFAVQAVGGYKAYKKIGIISILLSGGIFSISLLCYLMTFGYASGSENISGIFELSRSIYFNRFIQRVESIFLFAWVISSVLSTTASYYFSLLLYCKAFAIKDHRPLLAPFAILTMIVAIQPASMQVVSQINIVFLRQYTMYILYLPIIIIFLIAVIFKRGRRAEHV
jgi:spore germination protein (amino acid permease)